MAWKLILGRKLERKRWGGTPPPINRRKGTEEQKPGSPLPNKSLQAEYPALLTLWGHINQLEDISRTSTPRIPLQAMLAGEFWESKSHLYLPVAKEKKHQKKHFGGLCIART